MPGMPDNETPLKARAMRAVMMAVVLQTLFVFFFVFPGHEPKPNDLPIAVVGPAPAAAGFGAALQQRGDFDVRTAATPAAARRLIEDRDVYGAFVLGGGGGGTVRQVLVANSASLPVAQLLERIGQSAGAATAVDVKPLPEGDPRGVTLNLLVLPIVITSILAALAAVNLVPDATTWQRLGLAAAAGLIGGLIAVLIVNVWLDALDGPWLSEAVLIALAVVAIAMTSAGIIRLVGPAGVVLPFLLFLMLGNPASGLASAPELLPTPWAEIGPFLPPGALGSALRGTAAFDGAGVPFADVVLLAWAALGAGLVALSGRRGASARPQPAPAPA
jgi:hypothetical protein